MRASALFYYGGNMTKQEFIDKLNELPDDIIIVPSMKNQYGVMDLMIFTEKKSKEFLEWYLGP